METDSEIKIAIRELYEAKKRLAACERRVNELCGIIPEGQQRKPPRKTPDRDTFRKACLP